MSDHVLLILNELGIDNKMQGFAEHSIVFVYATS